jgi:xylose dehydrogenase (NAD/NADP)
MLRWGLLSTARINKRVIDAIGRSDRSTLVAVASRDADRAAVYAASHAIPKAFGSYEELIACDDVDAIYISLPNHMHVEWSVAALEAGKHVLCEKPLALTVAEVDRMISAAIGSGCILQEASAPRFHPQTADVASIIASGRLGRIHLCQGTFEFTLPATQDIRLDPTIGGGALWDLGCYPVAFFQAVLGEDPDVVYGRAFIGETGVDLTCAATMGYASGISVQFTASMTTPIARSARIVGERGTLELDQPWLTNIGKMTSVRQSLMQSTTGAGTFGDEPGQLEFSEWDYGRSDVYFDEVKGFEDMVLLGAPSPYPLADSRVNTEVITALHESIRTGASVNIGRNS